MEKLKEVFTIHSEQNMLIYLFGSLTESNRLYSSRLPCDECTLLVRDFFEAEGKNYEIIYSAIKFGKDDENIVDDYRNSLVMFRESKKCVSMKHYFLLDPLEYQIKINLDGMEKNLITGEIEVGMDVVLDKIDVVLDKIDVVLVNPGV